MLDKLMDKIEDLGKDRRKYIRYAICACYGNVVACICDNLAEIIILLIVFNVYVLFTD